MADNCRYVPIHFGARFDEKWKIPGFWGFLKGESIYKETTIEATGSLWDYAYGKDSGLTQYSAQTNAIQGPDCAFTPVAFGCFAAPTGTGGAEGKTPYDFITLKPGLDQFLYLDVGFWGGRTNRDFGLVCGPHAWLCSFGAGGGTPTPETLHEQHLCNFHRVMGNFTVKAYATVKLHDDDWSGLALKIYVLLPDMHMWADPVELSKNRRKFFNPSETAALEKAVAEGKLTFSGPDGSYRLPDLPPWETETSNEREGRWYKAGGWAAKKEQHLADVSKLQREEQGPQAFGSTAGRDLVLFLNALAKARADGYEIQVVQTGDLLDLWAPVHNMIDENPFDDTRWLSFTPTARKRLPLWLDLIYNNRHNQAALHALEKVNCFHVYGNHDVYLAFSPEDGKSDFMNRLRGSFGYFCENLLWVEHGHRFQPSNEDGYWVWQAFRYPEPGLVEISLPDLMNPPGPMVTTAVNYYPQLRKLADVFDNPEKNLYTKNVPYASIWYILAKQKVVKWKDKLFRKPDKFRIFVQSHTHSATLLKIFVNFAKKKKSAGAGG